MDHNTNEDYFSAQQAADLVGLSRKQIYRWLREGKLSGWRYGHKWRVRPAALSAAIERLTRAANMD